jgi:ZIP family zinc transporter
MSFAGTVALGTVAGLTIFLGLPVARIGRPTQALMSFLNAVSIGILLFLLYDVIAKANDTVETKLGEGHAIGSAYGLLLAGGLATGLLALVAFERLVMRRQRPMMPSGPGALAAGALAPAAAAARPRREPMAQAERVALFIAIGIGLHNFSEGLAIGQSAAEGAYKLFGVLVIGFGLHNITEGFGITAPLIGRRPSWGFLGLLGLIGGPTFAGTVIGFQSGRNLALSVLFLALAAGAIVYVIGELQHAGRKIGAHDVAMVGLLIGFLAGYGTDKLLFVAGG